VNVGFSHLNPYVDTEMIGTNRIESMPVKRIYKKWMHDWETRMTTRDTNRIVRPFEWGLEWTRQWPVSVLGQETPDTLGAGSQGKSNCDFADTDLAAQEEFVHRVNQRILKNSEEFFSYTVPTDFQLGQRTVPGEKSPSQWLEFTSPVATAVPVNNVVRARWYPARQKKNRPQSKKAVVLLPHWNSKPHSYLALCRILAGLGISTLRLSLPYHDTRLPAETERSDHAVSSNVCRTIDATRQAVIDTRCCYDWLQQQGYEKLGIVGTSLGSCYAFLASAHDTRIKVNAFNHASTHFADVVWSGQSTRHVRAGIEPALDHTRLLRAWDAISPIHYFDKFKAMQKKMLVIYATYDLTFLPEYSKVVVDEFAKREIPHQVRVLPCGHYSTGETPYKFLDGWHIGKFLKTAL